MADLYDDEVAQDLDDPTWIKDMAECGLVLLSKDAAIRKVHIEAVIDAEAKMFLLPESGLPAKTMIARFTNVKYAMAVRCQKRGPMAFMVRPKGLEKVELPPRYPSKADGPNSAAARALAA